MAVPVHLVDGSQIRDPVFTAVISERMRVPQRLRVAQNSVEELKSKTEDLLPVFSMHVPDRLALTDAPDLSPQPLFSQHSGKAHASSMWDLQRGPWDKEACTQQVMQSPLRRSYSDQTFGRSPAGTPTHTIHSPHSPSVSHRAVMLPTVPPNAPYSTGLSATSPSFFSPQSMLQVARRLSQQASNRILQTVTQKYSSRFGLPENPSSQPVKDQTNQSRKSAVQGLWFSPEEERGTTVELMVLRRQVIKMNKRIAGLERQNTERKQNELVLLSLLLSAVMLNGWLWMHR